MRSSISPQPDVFLFKGVKELNHVFRYVLMSVGE